MFKRNYSYRGSSITYVDVASFVLLVVATPIGRETIVEGIKRECHISNESKNLVRLEKRQ